MSKVTKRASGNATDKVLASIASSKLVKKKLATEEPLSEKDEEKQVEEEMRIRSNEKNK